MNKLPIGLVAYARFFESYITKTNENECKRKISGSCLSLEHIIIYVESLDLNSSLAKIHKCQTIERPMQSIKLPYYWV